MCLLVLDKEEEHTQNNKRRLNIWQVSHAQVAAYGSIILIREFVTKEVMYYILFICLYSCSHALIDVLHLFSFLRRISLKQESELLSH